MNDIRIMLLGIAVILFGISLNSFVPLLSCIGGFIGLGICVYGLFPTSSKDEPNEKQ